MFCFIPKFIYCCCFALYCYFDRFKLNIWDVGGQKSLRSYWRNYFESTDGLIWVVDCADKRRLGDCKNELNGLLLEEVSVLFFVVVVVVVCLFVVVCCTIEFQSKNVPLSWDWVKVAMRVVSMRRMYKRH